ncbi:MFS transporter [Nocardia yamanashiensis]|uniref:MFS transporter n=1 Tax=Nocardia yamanashiensis TaxID=209247 RepID=UPI001E32C68D|nr:MFS transporter [Nocardia yamanashiensis]UGT43203.1 MFS transporter [Nocardia yamanashiensis]
MLAMVTCLGILGAIFDPCLGSLVPDLVIPRERPQAVALMDLTSRLARIVGPGLAGLLLLIAPITTLFLADAATFAASTVALLFLARETPTGQTQFGGTGLRPQIRTWRLLREYPHLSTAFAVQSVGFFLMALSAIGLPLLLLQRLNAGPETYGWLLTSCGIASVLGNLTALHVTGSRFPARFCAAWGATGVLYVAIGSAQTVLWITLFATMTGFLSAITGIAMATHLTSFEPPLRLRLLTINHLVMRASGTAGMIVIPALIASAPAEGFVLGGIAMTLSAATGSIVSARMTGEPRRRMP